MLPRSDQLGIPWCRSTSPICHVQQRRRQEVLNPRDKIADPRTASEHPVPLKMPPHRGRPALAGAAAASVGTAHRRAPAGSLVGSSQGSLAGSSEPRPRWPRQCCGVFGRGRPWGAGGAAGEPREARGGPGVSVRGGGRHKAPGARAAHVPPACFSAVPRRRSHGHLSRAQREPPEEAFGSTSGPGSGGGGTAVGSDRTRPEPPGPFGPRGPPLRGQPGGTMITSAGEAAARGGVIRRGFAESGPWLSTAAAPRGPSRGSLALLTPGRQGEPTPVPGGPARPALGARCRVRLLPVSPEGSGGFAGPAGWAGGLSCFKWKAHFRCKTRGHSGGAAGTWEGEEEEVWSSEMQMPCRGNVGLRRGG